MKDVICKLCGRPRDRYKNGRIKPCTCLKLRNIKNERSSTGIRYEHPYIR